MRTLFKKLHRNSQKVKFSTCRISRDTRKASRASLSEVKNLFVLLLAFINDVRTFLSRDDDEVKRTVANIRALKKQFEGGEFKQAV